GRMRERAQLFVPLAPRAMPQLVDDQSADSLPAFPRIDRERPHFGAVMAERRELPAAHDPATPRRDDEASGVNGQLAEGSRQQMALFEIGRDEGVQSP